MRPLSLISLLAGCLLLAGCHKTKPQAPAQRTASADTAQMALVLLNQRMAEEADKELIRYINGQTADYTLDTYGFWYRFTTRTDAPRLQKEQTVTVQARIYTLQDRLLADIEETVVVGKKQVIPAIEQMLPLLREGESCVLLAPWYTAFGAVGSDAVAPYTNVKIELQTINCN